MKKLDIISTNIRVDSLSWLYSLLLKPFAGLKSETDMKKVHSTICSDLDLTELTMEFNDLINSDELH